METRKEMKDIFNKPIIISAAYIDKFAKGEMKKKRPHAKNNWYDWLNRYISKPIKNDG